MGDIARTVIMPGDPLRAKYIAEKYLKNVVCYNEVRGMLGYTGEYKGVRISVQGSGMGCPSMGIYSKELFDLYNVDNIIRVGSAGAISDKIELRDLIVAKSVYTNSNYVKELGFDSNFIPTSNNNILEKAVSINSGYGFNAKFGNIYTSDVFYSDVKKLIDLKDLDILGVEMETAALYSNASVSNKNALSILTVSDKPITGESLSAIDRQVSFNSMMEFALELAINI
ncbi:Purine nucleoside phosphorylase DeoD-type [compost metagenome]